MAHRGRVIIHEKRVASDGKTSFDLFAPSLLYSLDLLDNLAKLCRIFGLQKIILRPSFLWCFVI